MQKTKQLTSLLFVFLITFSVISCGSDSSPECETPPPNPAASANPPMAHISSSPVEALPGETMKLSGSESSDPDGNQIITYTWSQTDGEPVELSNTDQMETTFVVPYKETPLQFSLVVTDDTGLSSEPAIIDIPVHYAPPLPPEDQEEDQEDGQGEDQKENRKDAVYVSPNGSDAPEATGDSDSPVASLSRAVELAVEWGRPKIYMMAGEYTDDVTISTSHLTIEGISGTDDMGIIPLGDDTVTITAATGAKQVIMISGASDITIKNIAFVGSSHAPYPRAMKIESSSDITIAGATFKTPGSELNKYCRDVEIVAGFNVTITNSSFENGGLCKSHSSIVATNGDNLVVSSAPEGLKDEIVAGPNAFTFKPGNEISLTAVQISGADNVSVAGNTIKTEAEKPLAETTSFIALMITDSRSVEIADNEIDVDGGGKSSFGLSLRGIQKAMDADVHENRILFRDVAGPGVAAIKISSRQRDSRFDVRRNLLRLEPKLGVTMDMTGVEISSSLNPTTFRMINNVVNMTSPAMDDRASRTALRLLGMPPSSAASVFNNTFLVTGIWGEVHAIFSDAAANLDGNILAIATVNNIFLVNSASANNSFFSIREACATRDCVTNTNANLMNSVTGSDVYIRYYDSITARVVRFSGPVPGNYTWRFDNTYFYSLVDGELEGALREPVWFLARDLGINLAGVADDIRGAPRSDGRADIGAFEY